MDTELMRILSQLRTLHTYQTANLVEQIKALDALEDTFDIHHPVDSSIFDYIHSLSKN